MFTYLFDTSAVVHCYLPEARRTRSMKKKIEYLVEQRTVHREASLFIPSFCIAEVFNTFARMHFGPREDERPLSEEEYKSCLKDFREDIHWEKTFYSYDLTRNHILAVDEIIPVEHKLAASNEAAHLSTLDILVIAMACELAYVADPEKVYLVTCDRRMRTVFEALKEADESDLRRLKGDRNIGHPKHKRWIPPKVLLLQDVGPNEMPRVDRQPPLNL